MWSDVLKQVGWPTDVVVIDFETYFDKDYSLSKVSTIEFIEDPRFEILGVAIREVNTKGATCAPGVKDNQRQETVRTLQENETRSGVLQEKDDPNGAILLVQGMLQTGPTNGCPKREQRKSSASPSPLRNDLCRLSETTGAARGGVCNLPEEELPVSRREKLPAPCGSLPPNKTGTGTPVFGVQQQDRGPGTEQYTGPPPVPRTYFAADATTCLSELQSRYGPNLERATVCGHNMRFDGTILARKFGIFPPHLVDTRDLSRHLDARASHKLSDICERLGLSAKGDTSQFLGLHQQDLTDAQRRALSEYACNDANLEWEVFKRLLPRITRPEIELPLALHTHNLFWSPALVFDAGKAKQLVGEMDAKVVTECQAVGHARKEISGNLSFWALLTEALALTGEDLPMKYGKNKLIPALAKTDSAVKELLRHKTPQVRELMRARAALKSWPLHQSRLRRMTAQSAAAGGMLPNPLNYYGCHTGRWSGGERINTYNLPSRGGGLQCEMKKCLVAPAGHTLVMADAAQIEARGVGWIAGQDDLVRAFAEGRDIYSEFAQDFLGVPVWKPLADDPPPIAKLMEGRRFLGKVAILAMGYGMGKVTALDRMDTYPEAREMLDSGLIDLAFCDSLVKEYRSRYPKIPAFWRKVEQAFRVATLYGDRRQLNGLTLSRDGTTTLLRLPSGRVMNYLNARDSFGQLVWKWGGLWGGTLTENAVQAMARDLLVEALLKVEAAGFRVAHHVYDSIVACVPIDRADEAVKVIESVLLHVPSWATGWPLGVDIKIGERYA